MPEAGHGWMESVWLWIGGLGGVAAGVLLIAGFLGVAYLFFKWLGTRNP